jgi:hypothetical protein
LRGLANAEPRLMMRPEDRGGNGMFVAAWRRT